MKLKKELNEIKLLFRSIPTTVVTLFVVSVVCMNLLAAKTLVQEPMPKACQLQRWATLTSLRL